MASVPTAKPTPFYRWLYVHVYVSIGVFSWKQQGLVNEGIQRITRPWMDVISSIPMTEMISNVNAGATISDSSCLFCYRRTPAISGILICNGLLLISQHFPSKFCHDLTYSTVTKTKQWQSPSIFSIARQQHLNNGTQNFTSYSTLTNPSPFWFHSLSLEVILGEA